MTGRRHRGPSVTMLTAIVLAYTVCLLCVLRFVAWFVVRYW